ncbi:MAG: class I SAM-dependent methyltransferase [Proteobacteria bacterium]|nr:class I SAM-dependent methyltransferase [Pseudomonadota bacterium]
MTSWVIVFLVLAGGLFAFKIVYVLATAGALPVTRGALYVSTSRIRIRAFLEAVPMSSDQVLYDLGCGDGRVLRAAGRRYGVKAEGWDVNVLAYLNARLRCFFRPGLRVRFGDFRAVDLGGADVVFCYLFPDVMKDLAAKLERELTPGARVISANFPLPGWSPDRVIRPEPARHADPIFIYRAPEAAADRS